MAVLATMISIFLFYLLVIIWARRVDIRDRDSQVMTIECDLFIGSGHKRALNVISSVSAQDEPNRIGVLSHIINP